MKFTPRDVKLVRDIALSHVLSRDQILGLGYFGSVTRANTRLRILRELGMVKRLETPFFAQHLYAVGPWAGPLLGDQIGRLVSGRRESPRFLQHALSVTNARLYLASKGASNWFFEAQARTTFRHNERGCEARPDGLAVLPSGLTAVEVDLGHVAPAKFKEKLLGYDAFIASGECARLWKEPCFKLLVLTTGRLRAEHLCGLLPSPCRFDFRAVTFADLGIASVGAWS
ncbi:MAG: replication-relaxation family protein [Armatimonadota bacterium]